jgi:hypothetical protein
LNVIDNVKSNRFFWIYGNGKTRGGHAHKKCTQLIFSIEGISTIALFDKSKTAKDYTIYKSGIFVPPMIWVDIRPRHGSIVGVLAGLPFDADDYIDSFEEFTK